MKHPSDGTLRRLLDEPAAVSDADRTHPATCHRCAAALDGVRRDRDLAASVLTVPRQPRPGTADQAGAADTDHAWGALQLRLSGPAPVVDIAVPRRRTLADRVTRRPVAIAVAAGLAILGGTAAAAAADWLPVFRAEKVAPVTLSAGDLTSLGELSQLSGLSSYGDLSAPSSSRPERVADAATAAARTGLAVPQVAGLPTGVQGTPEYQVFEQQTLQFTFSAAKAAQAAKQAGAALPPMPAGLDGTRLLVKGGPGVLLTWSSGHGVPALMVGRAQAPTAMTQGASLPVVREYLLSLPGISPALAAQLRAVTGDGTTLPVPVPAQATASRTTIGGVPATAVRLRDGSAAGVVWVRDGILTGVGGMLGQDEVLEVARGLRPA